MRQKFMLFKVVFALTVFSFSQCYSQQWLWGRGGFGSAIPLFGDTYPIAVDNSGSVYIVQMDSPRVAKYNINGVFEQIISGTPSVVSVACDPSNNLYVYGYYTSNFTLGSQTFQTPSEDVAILKFDSLGNFLWGRNSDSHTSYQGETTIWGRGSSWPNNAICSDMHGNTYVTGRFKGTVKFGRDSIICLNTFLGNMFLVKYDPLGNVSWLKTCKDSISFIGTYGVSVAADNYKNVFVMGVIGQYPGGTAMFGSTIVSGFTFLAKYDSLGNLLWVNGLKPNATGISTDDWGNIYITGPFSGELFFGSDTLNSPNYGIYVAKFNSQGKSLWGKCGVPPQNSTEYASGYSICTDHFGHVYVCAGSSLGQSGSSGSDTIIIQKDTVVRYGSDPVYILKFDTAGNYICSTSLPSGGDDMASIALDPLGNVYLGGDFMTPSLILGTDTLLRDTSWLLVESGFIAHWLPCGCASSVEPRLTFQSQDTVCNKQEAITFIGSPPGGTLSGKGIYGSVFYPDSAAFNRYNNITYYFIDSTGCVSSITDSIYVKNCTGVNEVRAKSEEVRVVPNPNDGIFTIVGTQNFVSEIQIYNVFGQLVYSSSFNPENKFGTKFSIDLSGQPSGVYLYRVVDEQGSLVGEGKVVIV